MTLTDASGSASACSEQLSACRVLLIDQQRIFREALRSLFAQQSEFVVIGDAAEQGDALALIAALQPDVVVTELHQSGGSSVQHIAEIHARHPTVRILVLTTLRAPEVAARARKAGALGYLSKDQGHCELWVALREVAAGRWYRSSSRAGARTRSRQWPTHDGSVAALLTERQRQVLRSVALGYRTREIAQMLGISAKAVYRQRERLRHALQLQNTATLTRFAAREGLIES